MHKAVADDAIDKLIAKLRFMAFGHTSNWVLILAKASYALKKTAQDKTNLFKILRIYLHQIEAFDHKQAGARE